jgi:hypothetical protein
VTVHSVTWREGADSLVMDYRYRTDGEAVNKVMGQDIRTVGRREGGALVFDSQARVLMLEVKVAESWALSAVGDSLIMRRDTDSRHGPRAPATGVRPRPLSGRGRTVQAVGVPAPKRFATYSSSMRAKSSAIASPLSVTAFSPST